VAFYPQDATDQSQLIDCADKAMYLSKQQGRNRFNLFENIDSYDFSANC
jgi:GGDEF domain-containing protein